MTTKRVALFECKRHGRFEKITTNNAGPSFSGGPCPICQKPAALLQWKAIDPAAPFCPHCRRIGCQGAPRRLVELTRHTVLNPDGDSYETWRCYACTAWPSDEDVARDQALQDALEAAGHSASTVLNLQPKETS